MSPYTLEAGKTYSLVFRAPEGSITPSWNWIVTEEDSITNAYLRLGKGVRFGEGVQRWQIAERHILALLLLIKFERERLLQLIFWRNT